MQRRLINDLSFLAILLEFEKCLDNALKTYLVELVVFGHE